MKVLTRSTFAGVGLGFLLLAACGCANGCATMGNVEHTAYVSLATTQTVLETIQRAEIKLVCNRPGAPPAGACVPKPLHDQIQHDLAEAAEYGQQATTIMASLPDGAPQPMEVVNLIANVSRLVSHILASLPKSQQADALQAQLAGK